MDLKDKTVLLTGGSSGIGKATAQLLIEKGAKVAITARGNERLESTAKEIEAFPIQADVSDPKSIDQTYDAFLEEFGHLDILINNAGLSRGSETIDQVKREDFEFVFGVNVFGAAMMAKKAAQLFKKQNHGHIVNIGSTAALKGYERGSIYSASKFALRGMTQCWQQELRKYNIRVILVNPSYTITSFFGEEVKDEPNKLHAPDIAHGIVSALEMDDRGFIPELTVWATNPW